MSAKSFLTFLRRRSEKREFNLGFFLAAVIIHTHAEMYIVFTQGVHNFKNSCWMRATNFT